MRTILRSILIGAFVVTTFSSAVVQKVEYKRYKYKSGYIEYKFTGEQTGSETLYFDNYGMTLARHTNAYLKSEDGNKSFQKLDLIKGGHQYLIDLKTNSGTRTPDPTIQGLEEGEVHDLTNLSEENFLKLGAEKIGMDKVAEKNCTVWELSNLHLKVWIWEGFILRTTTKKPGSGEINMYAWDVQMNAPVPEDKLRVPPGANITESETDIDTGN